MTSQDKWLDPQCPQCGDENGNPTGWASETNPGTGGGTGRDEQIAVPCPRGCPDPDERKADALPMYDDPARDDGPSWSERVRSQLEAMTAELEPLAAADPERFTAMAPQSFDPAQRELPRGHVSLGADGRLTTVYPNGQAYTDPTPRVVTAGAAELAAPPMPDDLNTPEPAPQPGGGVDIWPLVCADAKSMGVPDAVLADMRARDAAGRCKYGVPLQAHNGRRPLVDAYQEALDLVAYLRQAIEEGRCGATVALFGCALVIVQRLRAMVALYA